MGWLDKGLKNIFKGGKDMLNSPIGLLALGVAAPYLASYMGASGAGGSWMANMAAKKGMTGALAKGVGSPMVSNALKNAALNYGIASLTGSEHPERSALWAGAASMPFTYMQGAAAAGDYNALAKAAGSDQTASWYDYALGGDIPSIPGSPIHGAGSPLSYKDTTQLLNTRIQDPSKFTDYHDLWPPEAYKNIQSLPPGGPTIEQILTKPTPAPEIGGYFTRDPSASMTKAIETGGIGSMGAMMGLENVDIMASLIPQVAGLYGGRMSEEEIWEKQKEKRIRSWAHRYGIPYEEAKEIWKHGWRNPYYQTKTPGDYGSFRNRGGYIDDYTAGGKAVGPGTGKSDSIQPVALSNGEFVFTEEATNNFPGGADGLYSLMNRLDPDSETATEGRA
jgi:hypothetical protein